MIKKILSPIVYAVFLVLNVITFSLIYNIFHLGNFPILWLEPTLVLLLLIIPGTIYFWVGNLLMKKIEKINTLKISDHFRQSSLCYLTFILILKLITYTITEYKNVTGTGRIGLGGTIFFIIILILNSILAILINARFVYKHKKVKI